MSKTLCEFTQTAFSILPWAYPYLVTRVGGSFLYQVDLTSTGPIWVPCSWDGQWAEKGNNYYDYKVRFHYDVGTVKSISLYLKRNGDAIAFTGWHARRRDNDERFGVTPEELLSLSRSWGSNPPVLNLGPEFKD